MTEWTAPPPMTGEALDGDALSAGTEPLTVLLIEDDPGDAFLVRELLAEIGWSTEIRWARSLTEAEQALAEPVHCILADLGLPDAFGLSGLRRILGLGQQAAVLVLTGLDDEHRGIQAVAAGAQDYLVKGQVTGRALARSIRYAVQRRQYGEQARLLREATLSQQENARLERGLLPSPLIRDEAVSLRSRYRPGRQRALLGGDFYDAVETEDSTLRVIIGDVAGHGPDEAALGVCLRVAWRTLVLAGHPEAEVLPALEQVLAGERATEETFATLCTLSLAPDRRSARLWLAGHPAPLLLGADGPSLLPEGRRGPALGLLPGLAHWPAAEVRLETGWRLLLYTDGLIEGLSGGGVPGERLGTEGLLKLVSSELAEQTRTDRLCDALITRVERLHGGPLTDDLAILLLAHRPE